MLTINQKQNTTTNRKRQEHVATNAAWVVIGRKRGKYEAITKAILSHQRLPRIRISNARLAAMAGCTVRTVTRVTEWLDKMGYITKHCSTVNVYDFNTYTISSQLKEQSRFAGWLHRQPEPFQDHIVTSIKVPQYDLIRFETVTQKSSLLVNYSLSINRLRFTTRSRARARGPKRIDARQKRLVRSIGMVGKVAQEWILAQKEDIVADILRDPRVNLVTPVMKTVSDFLKLEEKQYLKMIPFPDDILSQAYAELKRFPSTLKDPFGMYMSLCNKLAQQQNYKPDWPWYYRVCEKLGIDTKVVVPDERQSDMYQRSEPSHGILKQQTPKTGMMGQNPKQWGISKRGIEHIERESWPPAKKYEFLRSEKDRFEKLISEIDDSKNFVFSLSTDTDFLRRCLANVKEKMQEIERRHGRGY